MKRGLVRSIDVRNDGWVEVVLVAVSAGNTPHTLFVQGVDADLSQANRRLAKLALLRDALARTLPVEVTYEATKDQGDVIEDVTVYASRSLDGRSPPSWARCLVLSLAVRERGLESESSPYLDVPDEALAVVLLDSGDIQSFRVDLQRPYEGTAHAMVEMLAEARRTRRAIKIHVAARDAKEGSGGTRTVVACAWPEPDSGELEYLVAFVERIGRRSESLDPDDPLATERATVKYTTAPEQVPEGDRSENGAFVPVSGEAWVHVDSPLLAVLTDALKDGLQVKLGLSGERIDEVELVSKLGSAARPIWIQLSAEPVCEPAGVCVNDPTTTGPSGTVLDQVPRAVAWRGEAYFNEGIWRFVVQSGSPYDLSIDGATPCSQCKEGGGVIGKPPKDVGFEVVRGAERVAGGALGGRRCVTHAYLSGLHKVEIIVHDRTCGTPFDVRIYRIR